MTTGAFASLSAFLAARLSAFDFALFELFFFDFVPENAFRNKSLGAAVLVISEAVVSTWASVGGGLSSLEAATPRGPSVLWASTGGMGWESAWARAGAAWSSLDSGFWVCGPAWAFVEGGLSSFEALTPGGASVLWGSAGEMAWESAWVCAGAACSSLDLHLGFLFGSAPATGGRFVL